MVSNNLQIGEQLRMKHFVVSCLVVLQAAEYVKKYINVMKDESYHVSDTRQICLLIKAKLNRTLYKTHSCTNII